MKPIDKMMIDIVGKLKNYITLYKYVSHAAQLTGISYKQNLKNSLGYWGKSDLI